MSRLHRLFATVASATLVLAGGCGTGDGNPGNDGPVLTLSVGTNTPAGLLQPDGLSDPRGRERAVLQFQLAADAGEDIAVSYIAVTLSGTADLGTALEGVELAEDPNGNGRFDDEEGYVSEIYGVFDESPTLLATPGLVVPAGTALTLLVVVRANRWLCMQDILQASLVDVGLGGEGTLEGEPVAGGAFEYRDWCMETIGEDASPGMAELALGSDGRLRAGYVTRDGRLMFAERTASGWVTEFVEMGAGLGTMALGPDNEPRFAWVHANTSGIRASVREGGVWTTELLSEGPPGSPGLGGWASIATGRDGRDHVAWVTSVPAGVRYAVREAGVWTQSNAVAAPVSGRASIAVDALDRPSILYSEGSLWFAVLDGGTWTAESISGEALWHTLAFDSEGAGLVLRGAGNDFLFLRGPPGGTFAWEPLEDWTEALSWGAAAIAVGAGGAIGISSAIVAADCASLVYFARTPAGFEHSLVRSSEYYCAGGDSAALIEADGTVRVAWPETLTDDYGAEHTRLVLASRR
ncbi:MAG: hypothetical protein HY905_11550 [Deltaproteobacteria bacterium]|nr:hypothetical protein [Deltaproteobacteria bacterium]